MRLGLLLPGQGFQRAGILAERLKSHERMLSPILEEIDSVLPHLRLSVPLSDPNFAESLTPTEIAQPLILAASYSIFKTWNHKDEVELAMGHSLGEISTYACAGVLSLGDALKLVHERGIAMRDAAKSGTGMLAILKPRKFTGDWPSQLQDAARRNGVSIANYNSEAQTVLSGDDKSLGNTLELLKKWNKSVISQKLNVSGAFHSPFMAPAQPTLARLVETLDFSEPKFKIISNKSAVPFQSVDEIRASIPEMLVSPVKWQQSVEYAEKHVDKFVSLGPGRVGKMNLKDIGLDMDYIE